jgi:para-aminobenzoate synthetase component 1
MSLVYKSLPYINPHKIFDIVGARHATVFLDSNLQHTYYGRYSFIGIDPVFAITPESELSLQQQLECHSREHTRVGGGNLTDIEALPPFTGGLMGYLGYDYAKQLEPSVSVDSHCEPCVQDVATHKSIPTEPIIASQACLGVAIHQLLPHYWFGLYNQVFAFDNQEQVCYLLVTKMSDTEDSEYLLSKLQDIYDSASKAPEVEVSKPEAVELNSNFTKDEYVSAVRRTIEYIKQGDIFEANIAQRFSAKISNEYDAYQLYKYLQFKNPAPFSAYLNLGKLKILSASPERFIQIMDNAVEVRPIKGTIKRSADAGRDNFLAQTLQSSSKDRAENIMIVDLMRNDLSKICEADSIVVKQLCGLESFTNVHHLVSVVDGMLKSDITMFDIIKAIFPAGSITGAPKIRAQQIINELEHNAPRGVSYGSIGYIGFNGNIDLSVAIRTITIYNNELSFHVGGAVTLHSDPAAEYDETMLKAQKLFESLI